FSPARGGRAPRSPPSLDVIKDFREDFTVISGLCHAGNNPGFAHQATASFLTGAPGAGRPGFKNEISVDHRAGGGPLAPGTSPRSLAFSGEGEGLSWTRTGAPIPAATSPSKVFAKLFLPDTPEEARAHVRRLAGA